MGGRKYSNQTPERRHSPSVGANIANLGDALGTALGTAVRVPVAIGKSLAAGDSGGKALGKGIKADRDAYAKASKRMGDRNASANKRFE